MKFTICCLVLTCFVFNGVAQVYNKGCITMKVVDEEGRVIVNAKAGATFSIDKPRGEGWGTKPFSIEGVTDTNGMFTAEATGNPTVYYGAKKNGYYDTHNLSFMFTNAVLMRWQPWNPTVGVVLRKIANPIPMYAKHIPIESEIPVVDSPVGYDLMIGDWVAPYGKGKVADFVFTLKRRVANWKDFETHLLLLFSNPLDGIQPVKEIGTMGSIFRLPRTAPETSYQTEWTNSIGNIAGKGYFQTQVKDCLGYFFRVRTVVDGNGKLVHALYGKIKGPIQFDARESKTAHVAFTYYLNPTPNDRNVEFDPKRNLFKNLKSTEEVTAP